jgi:hypothetical protein
MEDYSFDEYGRYELDDDFYLYNQNEADDYRHEGDDDPYCEGDEDEGPYFEGDEDDLDEDYYYDGE